uniref:Uncharacterized protein n=1 Tax=Romanomermis culicivorax TaxID=13658 RepID=A0A915KZF0_ROMCU
MDTDEQQQQASAPSAAIEYQLNTENIDSSSTTTPSVADVVKNECGLEMPPPATIVEVEPPPPAAPKMTTETPAAAASAPPPKEDMNALSTRMYLDQTVVPILMCGLTALAKERPPDAIQFLADFLIKNKNKYNTSSAAIAGDQK